MAALALPYMNYVTNNMGTFTSGWCIYCLKAVEKKQITETIDQSTILCPHCMIDAVVDKSHLPSDAAARQTQLQQWHDAGFGAEDAAADG